MPVRDFFRLIIKLFALYSLILALFQTFPYANSIMFQSAGIEYWVMIITIFVLLILLFLVLIYSTDGIVNKLDLDRGFENPNIEFGNLNDQTIIKLGCIIIGGFLIVDHVGTFLSNFYLLFRQEDMDELGRAPYVRFATSVINLVMGYLLLTRYDVVSKWLALRKNESQ